jgi:hypothetical protein
MYLGASLAERIHDVIHQLYHLVSRNFTIAIIFVCRMDLEI